MNICLCCHVCSSKANEVLRRFSLSLFFIQHSTIFTFVLNRMHHLTHKKGLLASPRFLVFHQSWDLPNKHTDWACGHTLSFTPFSTLPSVHSFVDRSGCRPKWRPLNFGYHDVSLYHDRCGQSLVRQSCSRNNVVEPVGKNFSRPRHSLRTRSREGVNTMWTAPLVDIPEETQSKKRPTQCLLSNADHEFDRKKEQEIQCPTHKQCSIPAARHLGELSKSREHAQTNEFCYVKFHHWSSIIRQNSVLTGNARIALADLQILNLMMIHM